VLEEFTCVIYMCLPRLVGCDEVIVQLLHGELGHQHVWLSLPSDKGKEQTLLFDEQQSIALVRTFVGSMYAWLISVVQQVLSLKQRRAPSVMLHCVYRDPLTFSQRAGVQPDVATILGSAWDLVWLLACKADDLLAYMHAPVLRWMTHAMLHCNKHGSTSWALPGTARQLLPPACMQVRPDGSMRAGKPGVTKLTC
jgi:hypothetical protein